ncbi:hypothetical protein F8568_001810 [Actinomadura sp. LD22]|uniref:Glycosyltransferase RgtA/B/C/D-like domain-containing protein n=1 Tax=Actinomadura physcomitrii TaxID=2650748 RepID=A0A6I4M1G6_9ACTN|nr:hypothetical protein [Actinomadura physcomitrii]MVZ99141.1 hypothetical protein [Actinomadura physcomitrii]
MTQSYSRPEDAGRPEPGDGPEPGGTHRPPPRIPRTWRRLWLPAVWPSRRVRFADVAAPRALDRSRTRMALLLAVAVMLGSGLWLLRWSGSAATATPDTFWYARDALRYAGWSAPAADRTAAEITCSALMRGDPRPAGGYGNCVRYRTALPGTAPVRFQRIFTSRPGYPLLAVPFVRAMGPTGFAVATAALGVACGVAAVLLALAIGLRPVQALLAETLFYLLPTGFWGSRLLAEAPMMLCVLAALAGAVLVLRGRAVIAGSALLACALALLCVVKPANGVALAAALAAGAVLLLPVFASRRAFLAVAGIAALVLAGNLWISDALHLPGVHETLQDTFTRHFRRPDVPDPWHRLSGAVGDLWSDDIGPAMLDDPLIPAAFLLAAAGLVARVRWDAAWPLAAAGLTGAAVASMHPIVNETPRLTIAAWIPVAFGLAALAAPTAERPDDHVHARPRHVDTETADLTPGR